MDRHDGAGTGMAGHVEGLLRGGVGGEVGVVSADPDAGEVDATGLAEGFPAVEMGGVGAEEDAVLGGFEEEAAVAAVGVGEDAGAPVFDGDGGEAEGAEGDAVAPREFADLTEAEVANEVATALGGDHGGVSVVAGEAAERGAVEVVEVGVGEEQGVQLGQGGKGKRRGDVPGGAGGEKAEAKADARGEDGVGEEVEAGEAEEDGGVADGEGGGVGERVCGQAGRGGGAVKEVEESEAAGASAQGVGDSECGA